MVKFVHKSEKKRITGEVNIVFVDKKTIRRLNRRFLGESGATDVIAFPYEKGGDIFICPQVGRQNARRYKEPFEKELTRLVVHGTLHLLGYSDSPRKAREKMWARQEPMVGVLWEDHL